jgi:ATP-dependent Lhr-like helicase
MLDELCASGELCWAGAGSIGASDGRIVLAFRDRASSLLVDAAPSSRPTGQDGAASPLHHRLRAHLERAGASFWPDLLAAAADDDGHAPDDATVLAALWDLVWSGEVTNDSLAALRAHLASRPRSQGGRPRPGRLSRLGPPAAAGRWSLVAALRRPQPAPTDMVAARAEQLLERHGVLTREAVRAEGVSSGWGGGFAAVYPHLRTLEETGRVRRGYFVAGLGAAQFALPGAADRLRGERGSDTHDAVVLAATDPAQPYGAAIAWPELAGRPSRSPGARCVLRDGHLLAYVERGGHAVLTNGDDHPAWAEALAALVKDGRVRRVDLRTVDGLPARTAPAAEALREAGFVDGYRGLVLTG